MSIFDFAGALWGEKDIFSEWGTFFPSSWSARSQNVRVVDPFPWRSGRIRTESLSCKL